MSKPKITALQTPADRVVLTLRERYSEGNEEYQQGIHHTLVSLVMNGLLRAEVRESILAGLQENQSKAGLAK